MSRVTVRVTPRASRNDIDEVAPGEYRVKVTVPAVGGEANQKMLGLLAKMLGVPKSGLSIVRGRHRRNKVIQISALLCLLFWGVVGASVGQDIDPCQITAAVDRTTITIGDRIHYTITVDHVADLDVRYPDLGANLGQFEIKDYQVTGPQQVRSGRIQLVQEHVITTFTTGEYAIPEVAVSYRDVAGQWQVATAPAMAIMVESVKPEEGFEDIRPLKGQAVLDAHTPVWMWWVALVVVGLAAAAIGVVVWQRRHATLQAVLPPRPPEDIAREALDALDREGLMTQGLVKEYHDRLSDILRQYIEGRYQIVALDRTTEELYREMRRVRIERGALDEILRFLEACDLVKFAKYQPAPQEIEGVTISATHIIDITTPEPIEAATSEALGDTVTI